jgi:hypothetical protein
MLTAEENRLGVARGPVRRDDALSLLVRELIAKTVLITTAGVIVREKKAARSGGAGLRLTITPIERPALESQWGCCQ